MATQTTESVIVEYLENGVALVHLGNKEERVVTLTPARMASLASAVEELHNKRPKGVVFLGPNADMFTAGADINIIKEVTEPHVGEQLAKQGQQVFARIEALPCTTIAAISGPCVGGGCELVLACRYRIISDEKSSIIGLPEVKLGILPGFGGTQRLPRLVGLPKALDVILAGKTLRPQQALKIKLVDKIVTYQKLRSAAEELALENSKPGMRLGLVDWVLTYTSLGRNFVANKARTSIAKESKGFYPAPLAALDCAVNGLSLGNSRAALEVSYQREAVELGRLIVTTESKALVRIFFLTEASKSIGRGARKSVEHLQSVVVGAGVMGAGIAGILAKSGCSVILKDQTQEAVQRGLVHIKKGIAKLKYLSESERSFIINRIEATTENSANIGSATFAIEAIFEDLKVKQGVLGQLASLMPHDAIIATNTSSLSVTDIASQISNPERVVGMHFFNPVEKMPLIEIIRGEHTGDRTIAVVAALSSKLGKFPIVVRDVPGFLVNRILSPYLNEAAFLIEQGHSISAIDRAATNFGMPMGPVRLLDEVGLDVAEHVQAIMVAGYGDRMRGPDFAARLVRKGRKGKKTNAGFYDFAEGQSAQPNAQIRSLLDISSVNTAGSEDEAGIRDRLILSLINEAVRCHDEGVAGNPGPDAASQIDLGTVMGMGFPPFRGGLLFYADTVGPTIIHEKLLKLESRLGARFTPAKGIATRAKLKLKFQDRVP